MAYDSGIEADDIRDVFDTSLGDGSITTWVGVAESRVDDLPEHPALDSERKAEVTKFLAAAMLTAQDPRVDEESHEAATMSYGGESMDYADVALMLDPTDALTLGPGADASIGTLNARTYDGDAPGT